ncbi:hypothetical protein ABC977_14715 [Thioalkalicoccus limnaeus]|uniref:Sulfur globule protein CV1 n=1 Tax=Thioalkalicoccus limnaeus TaxID=120681 RepID=A0ABV4BI43_9GAMM
MPQDRIKSSFRLASLALTGCLVAYAPSGFAFFGNMNPSDWFGGGRDYYDGPGRYGYGGYPGYGPGGPYGAPFGGYGVPYGGGYGAPYGGGYGAPYGGGYGAPPYGGAYGLPPGGGYGTTPFSGYGDSGPFGTPARGASDYDYGTPAPAGGTRYGSSSDDREREIEALRRRIQELESGRGAPDYGPPPHQESSPDWPGTPSFRPMDRY